MQTFMSATQAIADVRGRTLKLLRRYGVTDAELPDDLTSFTAQLHFGVVLAGSILIEDDSLEALRDTFSDRLRAAEMEGSGFRIGL